MTSNCGALPKVEKRLVSSVTRSAGDEPDCESPRSLNLQTLYHRRQRLANCVVGDQRKEEERIVENCGCTNSDFEWWASHWVPI